MRFIDKISSQPYQEFTLTGNAGQTITMVLRFMPTQQMWMADFEYESEIINGVRVVESPNILRKYKNRIPFGIQCGTTSKQDPAFVDDFETQEARIYLLDEDDVALIEGEIYGQ